MGAACSAGERHVPEELVLDILNRVQLKTLFRCTSVCKLWYSLITAPRFIQKYLISRNVKKQVILSVRHRCLCSVATRQRFSIHRDNENLDMLSSIHWLFCRSQTRVVSSCNGLICVLVKTIKTDSLYLWNPVIPRLFQVPQPPLWFMFSTKSWGTIGFGFVSKSNDYKLVNIDVAARIAGVYELSTGYWKMAKNNYTFFSNYSVEVNAKQCFLNDTVHWRGRDLDKNHTIVTFDMEKDEFRALQVPSSVRKDSDHVFVTTFQDSLALIQGIKEECCICTWVMTKYGKHDSWTKQCTITDDPDFHQPLLLRDNGALLSVQSTNPCWGLGGDLISCDPKTKRFKKHGIYTLYADYFEESLALLDKKSLI